MNQKLLNFLSLLQFRYLYWGLILSETLLQFYRCVAQIIFIPNVNSEENTSRCRYRRAPWNYHILPICYLYLDDCVTSTTVGMNEKMLSREQSFTELISVVQSSKTTDSGHRVKPV